MSLLLSLIFNNTTAKGFQAGFSVIGSIFIFLAFFPQFWKIWKTKDTCSTSRLMYGLHFMVAFLYFISSVLYAASESDAGGLVTGNLMVFLNLFNSTGCLYVFLLKTQNMEDAKKLGMSELDFYNSHILPTVQATHTPKKGK